MAIRGNLTNTIIGVAAVVLIIGLAWQNSQLKAQVSSLSARGDSGLQTGDVISQVELLGLLDSETASLWEPSSVWTVVALITTTCRFCERSLDDWEALSADLHNRGVPFRVVSLDSEEETAAYLEDKGVELPLYVVANGRAAELGVNIVPLTVVLSATGTVEAVWVGEFDTARRIETLNALP